MIPLFGFYGTMLNFSYVEYFNLRHNNFYDLNNIKKYQIQIKPNNKIYFDTRESTFYYYLISGFIKNNFYYIKSNPNFKQNEIADYYITDNPLKTIYGADIFLHEKLKLKFEGRNNYFYLKFFSKNKTSLVINKKIYNLKKGYNLIRFDKKELEFEKILSSVKITGLKISKNQNLEWPWAENINLQLEYNIKEILDRNSILKKFYFSRDYVTYRYKFNFKELNDKLSQRFINCKNIIKSDIDTSMIIKLEC